MKIGGNFVSASMWSKTLEPIWVDFSFCIYWQLLWVPYYLYHIGIIIYISIYYQIYVHDFVLPCVCCNHIMSSSNIHAIYVSVWFSVFHWRKCLSDNEMTWYYTDKASHYPTRSQETAGIMRIFPEKNCTSNLDQPNEWLFCITEWILFVMKFSMHAA